MKKKIRKVRKQSKDASSPFKEKRTRQLDQIRRDISGDDNTSQQAQLSSELEKKKLSRATKGTVCADANVQSKTKFDSEEGLHIKNTVGLTRCQMRWSKVSKRTQRAKI